MLDQSKLSERELEILRLVATGASNKQIAERLVISTNTVKVHLRNIFGKLGVSSRTEAALYAIRERIALVAGPAAPVHFEEQAEAVAAVEASASVLAPESNGGPVVPAALPPDAASHAPPAGSRGLRTLTRPGLRLFFVLALLLVSAGGAVGLWRTRSRAAATGGGAPGSVEPLRWQTRAPIPEPRSGMAAATYENQIYALGGETEAGVTGAAHRYDPATDRWEALPAKPLPAADVSAAVVGGRIYVPGGRTGSGAVTDTLEVYDPALDEWQPGAPLPVAVSAYALAAFEGRLYLFGGWDGRAYRANAYQYDPEGDAWTEIPPLPTARGFAAAAATGDRIYVIGGTDGTQPLTANEEYRPQAETGGENPWRVRAPLPEGRLGMAVVGMANILHALGGEGEVSGLTPLLYFPQSDEWQPFDFPEGSTWSRMGLAAVGPRLYAFGGRQEGRLSGAHRSYQAIYTIVIPIVK